MYGHVRLWHINIQGCVLGYSVANGKAAEFCRGEPILQVNRPVLGILLEEIIGKRQWGSVIRFILQLAFRKLVPALIFCGETREHALAIA